jgi:hypothetical protein
MKLGVTPDYLSGLINHPFGGLRGVKLVKAPHCGQPNAPSRYAYNWEDVNALAEKLEAATG